MLHQQALAGREVERHGSKVDSVLAFQAEGIQRKLLLYLTAEGLLADFDLIDDQAAVSIKSAVTARPSTPKTSW